MIMCSSVSLTLRNSTAPHTLQKHVRRLKIADGLMPIDILCEAPHCVYVSLVLSEQTLELRCLLLLDSGNGCRLRMC